MVFDRSQQIPLASFQSSKTVGLDLMYPEVGNRTGEIQHSIEEGRLRIATDEQSGSAARWVGGFNPFATFELSLHEFTGTGKIGMRFCDSTVENYLSACIVTKDGKYQTIEWLIIKDGEEASRKQYAWPDGSA